MGKARFSYRTIQDLIECKCPERYAADLWRLYRHGWIGAAPIGEIPETRRTRLWVHRGYFSEEQLDSLQKRVDMGWENDKAPQQVSFEVMAYRQWLSLEEATSMFFYKFKLEVQDAKMWQRRMSGAMGGRIVSLVDEL